MKADGTAHPVACSNGERREHEGVELGESVLLLKFTRRKSSGRGQWRAAHSATGLNASELGTQSN